MIFYHPGKYERSLSARDSFDSLFFLYRWTDGWTDGIFTDGREGMGYQKGPLNFHFLSIYMFDGTGGRMGRVEGNEKCPLILFILCMYIDKVYTYLYR